MHLRPFHTAPHAHYPQKYLPNIVYDARYPQKYRLEVSFITPTYRLQLPSIVYSAPLTTLSRTLYPSLSSSLRLIPPSHVKQRG